MTDLQRQDAYIKRLKAEQLECPNCQKLFALTGNEIGDDNHAQCPQCKLIWKSAIGFMCGSRFWTIERDMEIVEDFYEKSTNNRNDFRALRMVM